MADHQRIHPVQEHEAPPQPTAPLVPKGSFRSEQGDPEAQHQQPPPLQKTIPYNTPLKPPKKRNCCRKCLCCTLFTILLIIIILGITAAIIFFVFRPKLPKYSVDGMRITQFNLNNDMSLFATFNVNITARNPNKKIGIYYEGGSHISVLYTGTKLCEGSFPKFYQGHRNTTVLDVILTGQTENATEILNSLQAAQQSGNIPLNLRVKVPIRIKLGKLKLMKWKFLVKCNLLVDSLAQDNAIRIRENSCKFRFRGFD